MQPAPHLYPTLKRVAPAETDVLIAAVAQAFGWDLGGLHSLARLIGADPDTLIGLTAEQRRADDRASGMHQHGHDMPTIRVAHPADPSQPMTINRADLAEHHTLWPEDVKAAG